MKHPGKSRKQSETNLGNSITPEKSGKQWGTKSGKIQETSGNTGDNPGKTREKPRKLPGKSGKLWKIWEPQETTGTKSGNIGEQSRNKTRTHREKSGNTSGTHRETSRNNLASFLGEQQTMTNNLETMQETSGSNPEPIWDKSAKHWETSGINPGHEPGTQRRKIIANPGKSVKQPETIQE